MSRRRRHSNTKGYQTIRSGRLAKQARRLARDLQRRSFKRLVEDRNA